MAASDTKSNLTGPEQAQVRRVYQAPPPYYTSNPQPPYIPQSMPQQPQYYGQPSTVYVVSSPMQNAPVDAHGHCLHNNMTFNYHYNVCPLLCIIWLCVIFFPWGLFALCALDSVRVYKCPNCGFTRAQKNVALYIVTGILTAVWIGAIIALSVVLSNNQDCYYYLVNGIQYESCS